jgi:hypothetical protein
MTSSGSHVLLLTAAAVRYHRVLFVVGTVVLAVAGSRVANDLSEYGSWILVAASVGMIAASDVAREMEQVATVLAESSRAEIGTARRDVVEARSPRWLPWALIGSVLLLVATIAGAGGREWDAARGEQSRRAPASPAPAGPPSG